MRPSYAAARTSLAVAAVVAAPLLMRPAALPDAAAAAPRPAGMKGPVANNDALYTACGRVFPDPQAFGPLPTQLPGMSPFAKGNAPCRAATFISYDEAISGLNYLESKFPDFVELDRLDEDFKDVLDVARGDGFSAGLPTTTGERTLAPLYLLRVTDEKSPIPEKEKAHFAVSLSIHGIERAGAEGGLRAAEDLATWGATSPDQRIMETLDDSLPAGEVLQKSSVYFILANPDGWRRGDLTSAGPFFSRYNGNGVDMNRDWPAQGYTFAPYTAWSEPETRSFGKVLKSIKPKWQGGLDLHGQLNADSFSFTLLRSSQRPYDKNQRMLQYVTGAWRDAEARLSWSTLIKPNDTTDPNDPRMYGVKWGTTWDTIGYTNTGSISNWFDADLGLGADAISNEMSLSHLSNCGTGNCFIPEVEQLHVDGNKSLIYGLVNFTLLPDDTTFRYAGRAGWIDHGRRVSSKGNPRPRPATSLPPQEPIEYSVTKAPNERAVFEFDIRSPADGAYNGGVSAYANFSNVQGVGVGDSMTLHLDRHAPDDPKAQTDADGWETVQSDFAGGTYVASGSSVDVISPIPGKYRVRVEGAPPSTVSGRISFTKDLGYQEPGQLPFSASNMDFFTDLTKHVERPDQLTRVPASTLLSANLAPYDSLVASDRAFASVTTPAARKALGAKLRSFVQRGGNLVLTDDALQALEWLGAVPGGSVAAGDVYAGHVSFNRTDEETGEVVTTYDDPLAANVAQPGAAEGSNNRHQITDPGPIGFAILGEGGGDASTQPQWAVSPDAWTEAGGRVVGQVNGEVTLGELTMGEGRIRILGSLIPMPTTEHFHPHGLDDYAITYAGYELVKNLLSHSNPGRAGGVPAPAPAPQPAPSPAPRPDPRPLPATGGLPWPALALGVAAAAVVVRRRHRTI
ncbi:MAG TPA: M14 family zinc carboxypeptidase [Mycobacteriales bacterium]|nr:M14 family zinc carboxypeptidase [Mycobacteriales bacterium]